MNRLTKVFLILLPVIAVIVWYLLKVYQFQINQEQYGDGMAVLQLSRGWLEGRPAFFDSIFGNHALLHNYYFILLVGFFTKFLGVYGLFISYLVLIVIFFWKLYKGFALFGLTEWTSTWLAAFFFLFGPMGYFIFLDYFGWHCEHYFIPLLALLALSLAKKQLGMSIIWLFLIFLVKESSAVLICCLLLFSSVVDLVLRDPGKNVFSYLLSRRNWIIVGVCLALLCLSLWWLSYLNGSQSSRLSEALLQIRFSKTLVLYVLLCLVFGLMTFGIALVPFIGHLRAVPRRGLIVGVLGGTYSILFIVFSVESLVYLPVIYPGISYPARLGGLWGFMLSGFIFLSYRLIKSGNLPDRRTTSWILTGCLLQFIFGPFLVAHRFSFDSKMSNVQANASYMVKTHFGLNPYPDGDARELYQLAKKMPTGSEVVVPYQYITYFQNVYPCPWNYNGRPYRLLGRPVLYVYQKELLNTGIYPEFSGDGYTVVPNENLLIMAETNWYNLHFNERKR